ncbi:Sugar phosphate phosphatase [Caenorhabditis elegans]|uniref:Sugar phosphate phosphatase n=1 Tax=Caenorhabditis elegans TaxID=6239 RepID=O45417_CAEEL|nr:Sugar phosphate phosphatase [Caenorhabditis elegans]CAB07370.1 Sugar phosphate phosphatase [Caenorhabditis elegans]|eukprot:NP_508025.1 Uncharacterized protein CELE_F31D4.2 [Caenorhabditis elegans]
MENADEYDHLAPKLRGKKEGTFAYYTVRDRWPKIVTGLVDQLAQKRASLIEKYGSEVESDIAAILEVFSKLRYEIMTDKPLCNLMDTQLDSEMWRNLLSDMRTAAMPDEVEDLTFFKGPWLFVECWLYRFIWSTFAKTIRLSEYDYFQDSKRKNFLDHLPQIEESAAFINKISAKDAPVHELFGINTILKMSLWGNRADMSLTGGDDHTLAMSSMSASSKLADFVLIDDVNDMIVKVLGPLKINANHETNRRIDIILDNSGVELTGDLIVAEFFISRGFADKVVIHGKAIPWFVSDVTKPDLDWTIEQLKNGENIGEESRALGEKLEKRMKSGQIVYQDHLFWISPHAYYAMEKEARDLYDDLKNSSLIIFKGDLNYRKLVGDRDWDLDTSFKTACRGFAPCPFMALRTLKAETVAGLSEESIAILLEKFEEDNTWMTSGEYAVCQLGGI